MDLPNLTQFGKFLDLLRKKGVKSVKIGEISVDLGSDIPESTYRKKKADLTPEIKDSKMTDEELLFWSSTSSADGVSS